MSESNSGSNANASCSCGECVMFIIFIFIVAAIGWGVPIGASKWNIDIFPHVFGI